MAYKKILSGYVNDSKTGDGTKYLAIQNMTDADIIIPPGGKLFLNQTPSEVLDRNPGVPLYSKSVKVEDGSTPSQPQQRASQVETVDVPENDDIPF